MTSLLSLKNKCQRNINDFCSWYLSNYQVVWSLLHIIKLWANVIGQRATDILPALSGKWVSMEREWSLAWHHTLSKYDVGVGVYKWSFDVLWRLKCSWTLCCSIEDELSCDCPGGCQLLVYRYLRLSSTWSTEDARQISLILSWHSLWRWGRTRVVVCFAYEGTQYNENG